jgi:hypothetical protein
MLSKIISNNELCIKTFFLINTRVNKNTFINLKLIE